MGEIILLEMASKSQFNILQYYFKRGFLQYEQESKICGPQKLLPFLHGPRMVFSNFKKQIGARTMDQFE
jgi:hypothetical protein